MSRKPSFVPLLAVLALVGLAGSMLLKGKETFEYQDLSAHPEMAPPEPQTAVEILEPMPPMVETLLVPKGEGQQLGNPQILHLSPAGELLVLDSASKRIEVFDTAGRPLRTLPTAAEDFQGFAVPSDFEVASDGTVWVADQGWSAVFVLSADGTLLRTHRLERPPTKVTLLPDGGFATIGITRSDTLLATYDAAGRQQAAFGTFLEEQERYEIALDGWLESDEVGTIYYAPARVGFFAAYNATGDRKYSRSTVEPRPLPQVKLIRDGRVGIDPETPWATLALEVQGSKVQLLRFLAGEHSSRPVGILDIYDSATGEYEVSMALPDRTYEIEVAGDSVYALTKEGLVRWSPESEEML